MARKIFHVVGLSMLTGGCGANRKIPERILIIGSSLIENHGGMDKHVASLAWDRALRKRPELLLHHTDNIHANVHGNYLAAAVLYATIFEESPEGLPYIPDDIYGDVVISIEDLDYLQGIAWATDREYLEIE